MENDIDIKETLKSKNQELFLNKKIIDLETSIESLLVFYSNYTKTYSADINSYISSLYNIDPNSEHGKIMFNTITSFFALYHKKLKDVITSYIDKLKINLNDLTDAEYNIKLKDMSLQIVNYMSEYYFQNIGMLVKEITEESTDEIIEKISNYFNTIVYIKIINILRDQFAYSIKVIDNNNGENQQVIQSINEKTLK